MTNQIACIKESSLVLNDNIFIVSLEPFSLECKDHDIESLSSDP